MLSGFSGTTLCQDQLNKISIHKYNCHGTSLIEPAFQKFWNWSVKYVPHFISPNLLTILGLVVNLVCSAIVFYQSPDAKSDIHPLSLYFAAFCIFIYQTFDALDGKHARKTNTCSPLGELLDHGCDCLSMALLSLLMFCSMKLGETPNLLGLLFFLMLTNFYAAHWQCYVKGKVRFGRIDVTESLVGLMIALVCTAVFGHELWTSEIGPLPVKARTIASILVIGRSITYVRTILKTIMEGGVGKNQTTVAGTSVLSPAIPYFLVIGLAIWIANYSPEQIHAKYPCLFLLTFGFVFSKITFNLVVSNMSCHSVHVCDSTLVGPLLLVLNLYLNQPIPEYLCLWFALMWSSADLVLYFAKVCREIAEYLGIHIILMPTAQQTT